MQLLQVLKCISRGPDTLGRPPLHQLCAPWTTSCQSMRAQSTMLQDLSCLSIRLLPRQLTHHYMALSTVQLRECRAALQTRCPGKGRWRQRWLRKTLLTRLWAHMQRALDMMST